MTKTTDKSVSTSVVGLAVVGLGRAFMLMLPTLLRDTRFKLVAATTPSETARQRFEKEFQAASYDSLEALCRDPNVDVVYIASPHEYHLEHVLIAAQAGKHVLVEKPMAISIDEAQTMVTAAKKAGIHLLVGPSHSYDAPVLAARRIIDSGEVGRVRMIQASYYTDFLYRPRRPEELDTEKGGGVVFSQAIHQLDVVRLLGGGKLRDIRALTGNWDSERSTEGAYSSLLCFEEGSFASITYSGYAHFDSDELMAWTSELGQTKDPEDYGKARRALQQTDDSVDEIALKRSRTFEYAGPLMDLPVADSHEHFGPVLVSCELADLRLLPDGVMIYGHEQRKFVATPMTDIPRKGVMDELYAVVVNGQPSLHSGEWGLASLEACVAILDSAAQGGREITLTRQVSIPVK